MSTGPTASGAGSTAPGASGVPPTPPRLSPTPKPGATLPGDAPTGEVRLRGTFEMGVENCLVLRTGDGKTYEILGGDPQLTMPGKSVAIRGVVRTDMVSTCMQGPIVQVLEMTPA